MNNFQARYFRCIQDKCIFNTCPNDDLNNNLKSSWTRTVDNIFQILACELTRGCFLFGGMSECLIYYILKELKNWTYDHLKLYSCMISVSCWCCISIELFMSVILKYTNVISSKLSWDASPAGILEEIAALNHLFAKHVVNMRSIKTQIQRSIYDLLAKVG